MIPFNWLQHGSARLRVTLAALLLVSGACLAALGSQPPPAPAYAATTIVIYADALPSGWADWSWAATINLSNTSPVHGGTHSIAVTYTGAWGALYLHVDPAFDTSGYDTLRFWINGGSTGNQHLRIVANNDGNNTFAVTPQANTWTQVNVPLSALGSPVSLTKLYWQDTTGGAQPIFYVDDIQLIGSGTPTPTPPPGLGPILSVNANANRHAISPYIYGMNFADEDLATELHLPVRRWGGNSTSRYNWQNDFSNTGSDWYFENTLQDDSVPPGLPNGSASDQFVDQDRRTGTRTLLTVPLIGWVAKTSPVNHPFACGFKVSKYGAQDSTDAQWDPDCGNGVHNGANLTGNNPTDTSLAVDHTFVQGWINHLTGRYGTAANGGVLFYDLDNEPMLWNSTHRDVHPQPTSYDEMLTRTVEIAPAIKAADPGAQTLGPVGWGWCEYFFSAVDGCNIGADYTSHGNTAFVAWYLQQMRAYEQAHGQRILDYLDLHGYPAADGVSLSPDGNAATQALRLRSTRSLWDPTYVDESWIGTAGWEGGIVRLIPRMKDWVSANYSGTKTALTEYNWGGLESINGAVAQADVLGIFGREGLDLATIWGPPTSAQPGAYAFRMFRNYDGAHGLFGDISVSASSANQDQVSVYAAQRTVDNALTLVIINKTTNSLTSTLSLANYAPRSPAQVYRYSAANLNAIVRQPDLSVTGSGFTALYPASSITLIVLSPNTLTVNTVGGGSVTKNPDQISYAIGTVITLTANPQIGWAFGNWSGDLVSSANPVTMTMTASKIVTATFTQIPYTLTVGVVGNGSVTKNPNQATYHYGDVVTVTATPTPTWYFAYWGGDLSGILNPARLTITGDKTVTATFTLTCPAITGVDFLSTPDVLGARRAVTFTAVISGGMLPMTYTWDFGDSGHTVTNLETVSHGFPLIRALQTYTVTLTAANVCNSFTPIEKPVAIPPWYGVYLPLIRKN